MLAQSLPSTSSGSTLWIAIAIVVVIAIVIIAIVARQRHTHALRERFGPEYDRTVETTGSSQRAEAELERREKRVQQLDIRSLTPGARTRYLETWQTIQARFVDDPAGAVADADVLLTDVMRDRGYPIDDPQHRLDDLSVEHGKVLDGYRSATEIARRSARGEATTEELRRAMIDYRTLFADLLGTSVDGRGTVEGRIVEPRTTPATPTR